MKMLTGSYIIFGYIYFINVISYVAVAQNLLKSILKSIEYSKCST